MSRKQTPAWKQETLLLSIVLPGKQRNTFSHIISSSIALLGASSVVTLYLLIPLSLLLTPFHDWPAQLIGAGCILVFVEGLVGMTLLKIAQSIQVKRGGQLIPSMLPIDYEKTVYLPLLGPNDLLDDCDQPTERLPAEWWSKSLPQKK